MTQQQQQQQTQPFAAAAAAAADAIGTCIGAVSSGGEFGAFLHVSFSCMHAPSLLPAAAA